MKAGLAAEVAQYVPIHTGGGRQASFHRVNTMRGNLKTAISGTYHAFKFAKYTDRCLAEAQRRFNRRFDLATILGRLIRAAATAEPYPARRLGLAAGGR